MFDLLWGMRHCASAYRTKSVPLVEPPAFPASTAGDRERLAALNTKIFVSAGCDPAFWASKWLHIIYYLQ